jgi:xanthosine utilization system XapX-like protein
MITHFLNLQWKSLFRSASFGKSIAIKIMMGFFAIYFILVFLGLGLGLYPALKELYPEQDPFVSLNGFLFNWFLVDMMMRFFFQKLPVMSVKPLLTLPIKKPTIVNYVLGKSALSFFNFLPLFAIVPFSAVLIAKGYSASAILPWAIGMYILTLCVNFLNFIIESLSSETEFSYLPIIVLVSGLYALNYFGFISFADWVGSGLLALSEQPLYLLVPIVLLALLYIINYKMLIGKLYLDSSLKTKSKEVKTTNLEWTRRFGDIAPFMQLDLKLIWRNKRSKSSAFILVIGLLYGLIFYPNPSFNEAPIMLVFVGIFVTGIFLINFGQFIPAWDSAYYKLLMSQNIKYEQYLKSKFILMVLSVVILTVLSIPYVYFGWNILILNIAAALYNAGVNSHVILYAGSFNRKKIDLNQRAAFNYQGTGAVQWLLGIPLILLPMLIFALFNFTINFEAAVAAIAIIGLIGIVFHQKLMTTITQKYQLSKYKMIDAFGQDE